MVVKIYPSTARDGSANIIEVLGTGRIKTTELETLLSRDGLLSAMGLPDYQYLMRLIKEERAAEDQRNQRTDW
jgi:hypothetical protein